MQSLKCPSCSLVQWADNQTCKRCGAVLGFTSPEPLYNAPQIYSGHPYNYSSPRTQLKTGLALTSMVLGIVAFPTTFLLFGLLLAPIAVILGIVALRKASKQPSVYGGKGFAIAGIAVGSVVCVFFVPLIAAIAIPNLLAARRAANEGSAITTIKRIVVAQHEYLSEDDSGECGDLMKLAKRNLVDPGTGSGKKNGYNFLVKGSADGPLGCEVVATPESPSHGTRSFYYSTADDILRVSSRGQADHNAPELTSDLYSD